MARPVFRSNVARFRVLLLVALLFFVGALAGLFVFGQTGKRQARPERRHDTELEEGIKLFGKGFKYTYTIKERSVFHIESESITMDKDNVVELAKVGLTLWDREGHRFEAESEAGSFNRATNEGVLHGDVVLTGPSDLEIHTNRLELREKGQLALTPVPARIIYGGKYFIRCDSLQAWLPTEIYTLVGDVRVVSLPGVVPPVTLDAPMAVYERRTRQVRLEQGAEIHRGDAELNADRISASLSQDESALTFVRALWNVRGKMQSQDRQAPTTVTFSGNDLAVLLEPGHRPEQGQGATDTFRSTPSQVRKVDLEGLPAKKAVLETSGGGFTRTLVAPRIEGVLGPPALEGGAPPRPGGAQAMPYVLTSAEAFGGVDLHEIGPPKPPRQQQPARGTPATPAAPATPPIIAITPAGSAGSAGAASNAPALAATSLRPGLPPATAGSFALASLSLTPANAPGALPAPAPRAAAPVPAGAPAASAAPAEHRPGGTRRDGRGAAPAGGGPQASSASPSPASPAKPSERQAHGSQAKATFLPDGRVATVTLIDQVTYGDGEVTAAGNRADMDLESGLGDFVGTPVEVTSPRGQMHAPHVIYTSADELVHAVDGVRAVLKQSSDTSLAGTPLGAGKGPVSVQAQEGYWQRVPSSFIFRGDVRAWRDDNLLLTPELIGERLEQGDQLRANGGVKSIWVPAEDEPAAPGKEETAAASGSANPAKPVKQPPKAASGKPGATAPPAQPHGPITVLAAQLLYRDGAGVLTYTGNVRVDQDGKTLSCQQLDVQLDKDKKAKDMTCTGQAHLSDPVNGRNIDGQKAVYRLASRKVDITGDLVTMRDRAGNVVRGQRLVYAIDDGKVEVLGKIPASSAPAAAGAAKPAGAAP